MNFKRLLPHVIALVVFFLAVFLVFGPQFSGKVLQQGDISSFKATAKEMIDYQEQTGDRATWTTTSFGGMPTHQVKTIQEGNLLYSVDRLGRLGLAQPAGIFLLGMICCYLFLIVVGVDPWLSLAGALAAALATTLVVVYASGHITKVRTIFYLPLVAAGAMLAFRKRFLLGGLFFALGMGLAILANHPQMLFYFGMTFPILGIAELVRALRAGELADFGKAVGVLVIGLLLAAGAGASNLIPTMEYAADSMRGGQVLETPLATETTSTRDGTVSTNGLSWDYAMQWSNNIKDIVATYAPLAAGGGGGQPLPAASVAGAVRNAGFAPQLAQQLPAYHGGKIEGTAGPEYLGAVVWALFLFGLFTARRSIAAWLGGGTLLVMILSMGKYAAGINEPLYDLVPLLNKFRAPSSALNILPFMMASLGLLGIQNWLTARKEDQEKAGKKLMFSGIAAVAFGLFVLFVLPAMIGFDTPTDSQITQAIGGQNPDGVAPILAAMKQGRAALYAADAWRSFLFLGLTFGVLFALWKQWVNTLVAGLLLVALIAFDFSGINSRYFGDRNWKRAARSAPEVAMTPADQQILADQDPQYRVLNLSVRSFNNDPTTSYYHRSVGGYSPVKTRRYNDLIASNLVGQPNQAVLDMLNTRYLIVSPEQAQRRPTAYGPAWLVSNVQMVNSNDAELAALKTVGGNLKNTAVVHEDFAGAVQGLSPNGQGTVQLTDYSPIDARYSFNSASEQLVVFSEMYYGPDKGWEVTIDGSPAELLRANYVLRALRVPAGQHEIVMTFNPSSYTTGVTISYIASLLILLGIIGYAFYFGYWRKRGEEPVVKYK